MTTVPLWFGVTSIFIVFSILAFIFSSQKRVRWVDKKMNWLDKHATLLSLIACGILVIVGILIAFQTTSMCPGVSCENLTSML